MTAEELLAAYGRAQTWDEMMAPDAIRAPYLSLFQSIGEITVVSL